MKEITRLSWEDLERLGDDAEERIRNTPYDQLGPAARLMRDFWDKETVSNTLLDIQNGVYG